MTRPWLLFLATACTAAPPSPSYTCHAPADTLTNHPHAHRYQRLLDEALALGTPAVSAAVISPDGLWLGAAGVANLAQDVPAEPCQQYHVASVTKMFAASAALQLAAQGELDLDAPVAALLSPAATHDLPNLGPAGATVRDLLQHTSGIPDYLTLGYLLEAFDGSHQPGSADQELDWVRGRPAEFEPGTDFEYSNANYLVLSLVLAEQTGQPAYTVVRDQVLQPLGLDHTLGLSEHPTALVRGYLDLHGNGVLLDQTALTASIMGGAGKLDGGLVSTPHDVALLLRALAHDTLLPDAQSAQMQQFRDYGPDDADGLEDGYGLGLARIHTHHGTAIGHYGTVHPYQTLAWHFPDQDTTVVLSASGMTGEVGDWINSESPFDLLFDPEPIATSP